MLGHTRWASIGIISQPNAHPMSSDELARSDGPFVTAALNGDVDNFADIKVADGLRISPEITSDAKVIPTVVSRRIAAGEEPVEAFRQGVGRFDGSVAIAASVGVDPRSPPAGPARQRPGPVRRPRRRPLPRRVGAVRRRRGGVRLPPHGRRDAGRSRRPGRQPRPGHRARRHAPPARSTASAASPTTAPSCRSRATSWSPPRSRPATSTVASPRTSSSRRSARRRARSARRCGARSPRSTAACSPSSTTRRCRPPSAGTCATARSPRIQVIGQGTAAVAGASLARALREALASTPDPGRGGPGHRAVGLRAAQRHARHARHRHQPVRHHHRHQPHRRPRAGPGRPRSCRS